MSLPLTTPRRAPAARRLNRDERRAALLQAAAEVFFEQGYAAATIDAVIARAGGSRRALYDAFGNKEGLFAALVGESVDAALRALTPEELGGHGLRAALLAFGRRLMAVQMSPTVVGLYRVTLIEARRFPHLAEVFYASGPARATVRLVEVLAAAQARGEVRVADAALAADQFLGLIRDNLHLQVVLGLRAPPDRHEAEARVAGAVDLFLHGVRAVA